MATYDRSHPIATLSETHSEDWMDKTMREVQLLWYGVLSVPEAAVNSMDEVPLNALPKLAWAIGAGIIVGRLFPARGIVGAAVRSVQPAFGLTFTQEITRDGEVLFHAIVDNWRSSENWASNLRMVETTFCRLTMHSAFVLVGTVIGQNLGTVLRPDKKREENEKT